MKEILFHNSNSPTQSLKEIFKHLGHRIKTLQEANDFAQKNLLRVGERWDKQDQHVLSSTIQQKKDILTSAMRKLGMLDVVIPQKQWYDYVLITGELEDTVQEKLNYLAELKKEGLNYSTIYLLGGERQLLDDEKLHMPHHIKTEAEMMLYLAQHHPIIKNSNVILINAPRIQLHDGTWSRPTTESTLRYFSQEIAKPGTCLLISNTPYIIRQTTIAQQTLDQTLFPVEGIGRKMNQDENDIFLLIDEFARTLYEIYKVIHQRNNL